jgi:hypothetical protein
VKRGEIEALVAGGEDAVAAVIARLEARIAELEARLGANSSNSSKPPISETNSDAEQFQAARPATFVGAAAGRAGGS